MAIDQYVCGEFEIEILVRNLTQFSFKFYEYVQVNI